MAAVTPLFAVSRALHVPWYGLVKLYPILADALIAALIYLTLRRSTGVPQKALWGGLFYALNPVSIAITSVHGNYIAVPTSLLFLSAYLLHYGRARWAPGVSALACGFAIMTKTWPLLFLPLLLARVRTWGQRGLYLALTAVFPLLLVLSLYFRPDGGTVVARCLAYQSIPGWWGFTGLWHAWDAAWVRDVAAFYADQGSKVLACVLIALYLMRLSRRSAKEAPGDDFFAGFVLVGLTLLVFAQGFGPQYLVWVLPFAVVARDRWVYVYAIFATLLFVVEYGFRPFTGGIGYTLREIPSSATSPQYFPPLSPQQRVDDNHLTNLLRLPVWLFLGAWLVRRAWPWERRRKTEEPEQRGPRPKRGG